MRSLLVPSFVLFAACTGEPAPDDSSAESTCPNGQAHALADATALAAGATGSGETCDDGTADWWAFDVAAPGWYTLAATADDSNDQRVLFTVVDPDGDAWTVAQYQPGSGTFYVATAGTWYVQVAAPGVDVPLAYTITPAPADGASSSEDETVALDVTADAGVRVAFAMDSASDTDAVSVTAPAGTWLTVRKDPVYQEARMSAVSLTFLDASGNALTRTLTADSSYVPVGDAPVQLSVAADGAAGWTGVELRLRDDPWTGAAEPNETQDEAAEFADDLFLGTLDEGDADWFHTTITADAFLGVYCTETVSLLEEVGVEVWDASGQVASVTEEFEGERTEGEDMWVRITGSVTGPGAWYSCRMTNVRPPAWKGE